MSADDDLRWYVPGFVGRRRRKPRPTWPAKATNGHDTTVTVRIGEIDMAVSRPPLARGKQAPSVYAAPNLALHRPTRYAMALRRQATNRARRARGEQVLPAISPGNCSGGCGGWGIMGSERERCPRCLGSGEEG